MSESKTKSCRRTVEKAKDRAAAQLRKEHVEIITRYLDEFCGMRRKSRRQFCRMIMKKKNPMRGGKK